MLMLHGLDGVDHVSKPAKVLICHEGFNTLAWGDHPDIPVALHLPMTFTIWPWLCSQWVPHMAVPYGVQRRCKENTYCPLIKAFRDNFCSCFIIVIQSISDCSDRFRPFLHFSRTPPLFWRSTAHPVRHELKLRPLSHGRSDPFSILVKRLSPSWRPEWSVERNMIWTSEIWIVSWGHTHTLCCHCLGCLCPSARCKALQLKAENQPMVLFPLDCGGCGGRLCFSVSNI